MEVHQVQPPPPSYQVWNGHNIWDNPCLARMPYNRLPCTVCTTGASTAAHTKGECSSLGICNNNFGAVGDGRPPTYHCFWNAYNIWDNPYPTRISYNRVPCTICSTDDSIAIHTAGHCPLLGFCNNSFGAIGENGGVGTIISRGKADGVAFKHEGPVLANNWTDAEKREFRRVRKMMEADERLGFKEKCMMGYSEEMESDEMEEEEEEEEKLNEYWKEFWEAYWEDWEREQLREWVRTWEPRFEALELEHRRAGYL